MNLPSLKCLCYLSILLLGCSGIGCTVIDHTRFAGLIAEQSGGAAPPASGELIHATPLRGIDFILVCNISALSVCGDNKPDTVSVARVEKLLHLADPKPRITTRCVVNLRLIDPATGCFAVRIEDSFQRVCSPEVHRSRRRLGRVAARRAANPPGAAHRD